MRPSRRFTPALLAAIVFVPQQLGEFAIEPGTPYVARFRFIVADGAPDRALLDAYWHGYAQPATVRIEKI